MIVLIYLGPPGVGKGAQAKLSAREYGVTMIEMGILVRDEISLETDLGKALKPYNNKGRLAPDNMIMVLLEKSIVNADIREGFILDGVPRTLPQVEGLEKLLEKMDDQADRVLFFNAPEKMLMQRLLGRRNCSKCGLTYNVETFPPKKEGICDICGGRLITRKDQDEESIKKRMEEFREKTLPVIDYYREKKMLSEIDAKGSIDEVQAEVARRSLH